MKQTIFAIGFFLATMTSFGQNIKVNKTSDSTYMISFSLSVYESPNLTLENKATQILKTPVSFGEYKSTGTVTFEATHQELQDFYEFLAKPKGKFSFGTQEINFKKVGMAMGTIVVKFNDKQATSWMASELEKNRTYLQSTL